MEGQKDGEAKIKSLRFSSKRQGTIPKHAKNKVFTSADAVVGVR